MVGITCNIFFSFFVNFTCIFFFFVFIASTKGEYPRLCDKKFIVCTRVCRRVRSYYGGIKSLERSALRLKRQSTQNFCVTKSSTHVIPKMMSKSMLGEEMKCEIGFGASLRSLLRRHWRAAHSMMKWKKVSGAIKHSLHEEQLTSSPGRL